jgi:hypothetical protein
VLLAWNRSLGQFGIAAQLIAVIEPVDATARCELLISRANPVHQFTQAGLGRRLEESVVGVPVVELEAFDRPIACHEPHARSAVGVPFQDMLSGCWGGLIWFPRPPISAFLLIPDLDVRQGPLGPILDRGKRRESQVKGLQRGVARGHGRVHGDTSNVFTAAMIES